MVVRRVICWDSANPKADLPLLQLRMREVLGGESVGKFRTTCELFHKQAAGAGASAGAEHKQASGAAQQASAQSQELFMVTLSDVAECRYLVFKKTVLEVGKGISRVLTPLKLLNSKAVYRFEGAEFAIGDFGVRLGSIVSGTTAQQRRIVMEVEYKPSSNVQQAHPLIEEFARTLVPPNALRALRVPLAWHREYGLDDVFSPRHLALDYVKCLTS